MSDESSEKNVGESGQLYGETMYFVDAMVADYDYYHRILDMLKDADTEIALRTKDVKKTVDETWVKAIEDSLFALDHAVRNPIRYIKEVEEVVPIERARNISQRSIKDLSRHSNYISSVEGGEIMPSKILNVYRDETLEVYENKFINTLIQRLFDFLAKRYPHICGGGAEENVTELNVKSDFLDGERRGTFSFSIESSEPVIKKNEDGTKREEVTIVDRVDKLMGIVKSYMNTELVQVLGKSYIRPPVMHTNAILKNKNLKQCLDLWEFIESYDKIGYEIETAEKVEKPNEKFIADLYAMLGLQYVIFRHNTSAEENLIVGEHDSDMPIAPRFSTEYNPYVAEDFTVFDSEYKKLVPYSELSKRKALSPDEVAIRRALEDALVADEAYAKAGGMEEIEKSLEAAEQQRIELKRIKEEEARRAKEEKSRLEREEAERIAAEKAAAEKAEAERIERERIEAEKAEAERREIERIATEKAEAERREIERIATEKAEAERLEAERIAAEKAEADRIEAERLETERIETERIAAERAEAERLERERIEAERAEAERQRLELIEKARLEAEAKAKAERERYLSAPRKEKKKMKREAEKKSGGSSAGRKKKR